jgi:hypothetical protein
MTASELTLAALDADDLQIMSARLQDAVTRVGELVFLPKTRRFAAVLNRYRWEVGDDTRVQAGLSFEGVTSAVARNVRRDDPEAVLCLLAIRFHAADAAAPAGAVELVFAGGGTMRLEVECIDATLSDLGEPYPARARPSHEDER